METHSRVLITGGSSGIGLELARRFRADDARVIVTGSRAGGLDRARAEVDGLETIVSDIGEPDDRERLAAAVLETMPDLDLVINNAGVQRRIGLAEDHAPWAERERELQILLSGPIHLNHLLLPHLVARGGPATIVDVTSGGAFAPQPFAPLYSAAKAALHSYTENLRHALRGTGIHVLELIPPAVATPLAGLDPPHGADPAEFAESAYAAIVAGRPLIGFGPTDTDAFRARLEEDEQTFRSSAERFRTPGYADPSARPQPGDPRPH